MHRRAATLAPKLILVVMLPVLTSRPMLFGQATSAIQVSDLDVESSPFPAAEGPASQLYELVTQGKWTEASAMAQRLARENPNDRACSYYLGLTLVHSHDAVGAIRALRNAQQLGMDSAYFHEALGIAYYNAHQFILFQQQMDRAVALAPDDYKPYYYVGTYLESMRNDFPGALRYFVKARTLNVRHAESWYHEGYCLEATGARIEARIAYETAISCLKKNSEALSLPNQGMARLLADTSPNEALQFAYNAVQVEPGLESNHVILAKICEKLGRLAYAKQELQTAEQLDPTDASPRFMLARIYSKLGDRDSAQVELATFKKIKELYGEE